MKKWFVIACLLAVICACSDEEKEWNSEDSFLPVSEIRIPVREYVDTEIRIEGKGFVSDCEIWMERNGGGVKKAEVVRVDESGITFTISGVSAGFYIVILKQGDTSYRIGGINILVLDLDPESVEAYGAKGELDQVVYPVSFEQKSVGRPLFSVRPGYFMDCLLTAPDRKIYYTGFKVEFVPTGVPGIYKTLYAHYIDYYDLTTKEQRSIPWGKIEEFVAIGLVDGELHALRSADTMNYTLVKLDLQGNETPVRTFDFSELRGMKIWNNQGRFDYDSRRELLIMCGYTGIGSDLIFASYVMNLATGEVNVNASNSVERMTAVLAGEEVYYFCRQEDETGSITRILKPADPANWSLQDPAALVRTLTNVNFMNPVYFPDQHLIYGIGEEETVLAFQPETGTLENWKWVKSGFEYLSVK